ncbi:tubulin-specific chaperone A [Acyrthosiphon pisum]|uniref:Tubulin-specific chaperone A n=1 Tax=Acyrthosiphon pisum TaxID=7029 RepID=A0A8R1X058_ACYPI|nr:tubulin-specific chaperone A [Acyrthosiphon pisum]|eukprot:XP_008178244.1 PREDICTED: tubulin-specific chaperone A [Acyrthosiphon pisum]
MADPRIKTLKIKTGVVKRLTKEKLMYIQETDQQQEKVEKLKKAGIDENTLKKQEEVLRESQMMIPDTQRRLKAAFEELKSIVADCEELKEEQDYLNAQKFLAEAEKEMN